ncbi:hypothetical protein GCK72_023525 [Caenorhabditis remanei]|uniref:F-box domain-containing protein n=1 Tax=Caenorhabditis remanei TaxID=31234 RepID=A0A6A5FWT9_CAERE|nr:hypothetical protein GCK72_023525 [Caenorhabditis remanei]KAF1747066.1 hypothetical protein GCK72_023525 [Caenorhabditis remanei]
MTKTLLDMPDVAMTEIMSYLDYMTIQNTRKTCWKLRNFLEAVQFDPRIRSISFYEREDRIIATMSTEKVWNGMEGRSVRLQYMTKEDGCKVTWQPTRHDQKVTIVKNEHYKDVFWRDLKILLTSVRTTLRSFSVTTHNSIHQNVFATKLEKILKLRREAIQVETISIEAFNPTEVAQILQCFDSKPLVWLVINNTQSTDAVMDITEIVRLDHWKQTKHITMDSWRFPSVQMKHFAHFQISDIHYTNFIAHKIKIVKEMFLQSTEYEKTVNFNTNILQQKDKILQALGRNIDLLEDTTYLYFNTKHNSNNVLFINVDISDNCISFSFIKKSEVPSNVEVE